MQVIWEQNNRIDPKWPPQSNDPKRFSKCATRDLIDKESAALKRDRRKKISPASNPPSPIIRHHSKIHTRSVVYPWLDKSRMGLLRSKNPSHRLESVV
jgi:hypothetical protein